MAKQHKVATHKSEIVRQLPLACSDELAAVEFVEAQRWNGSPVCPRCGSAGVSQMKGKDGSRNARFLWRCRGCKRQYTVRVGTIMEDSPVPFRHWCYAFWAACASKKGVSAKQIERQTGVTYKTALFMMHRIRWAMAPANDELGSKLEGIVEADEAYVGGKPRKSHRRFKQNKASQKPVVFGMVQRGGSVRLRHLPSVKGRYLKTAMRQHIAKSARLMTDEAKMYKAIGREFEGGHDRVFHKQYDYAHGDVTTNTIEGVFALLKRSLTGTYHSVTKKHLHRYLSEVEYRYNTREMDDGERTAMAIRHAFGKRLTYKEQTA
ncbi:MAG: IS1595 family transposase [Acidobacteriota bacterium]|nr:IS1595 family transposase [Acidobacteriota bacterium]